MIFNHLSKKFIVPDVLADEKNSEKQTQKFLRDEILPQVSAAFPLQSQADNVCLALGNKTTNPSKLAQVKIRAKSREKLRPPRQPAANPRYSLFHHLTH